MKKVKEMGRVRKIAKECEWEKERGRKNEIEIERAR